MGGLSKQAVIAAFLVVAVSSAIVGGVAALALFKPDPEIIVERIEVEVEPREPILMPSPTDFNQLVERYIELSGSEDEWTASLVEEIAGAVCDGGYNGAQVMQDIGLFGDIVLDQNQLDAFVGEVRITCPEAG